MTIIKITFFHLYFLYLAEAYPSSQQISISITRHYKGDIFTVKGEKCYQDVCAGLSGGTAKPTEKGDCECKCSQNLPVFRDDLNTCVDDIQECSLVPFVSGTTVKKIPYVFLPLKGQIIYPSAEIMFSDAGDLVCVVSGGQFLGRNGWMNLRNNSGTEPPLRLFRDEEKTYLQWLGEISMRMAMEGRIILVHLMCKDASPTSEEPKIFTPCIAFRVAGNPSMREVLFATDVHLAEGYTGGFSLREYVVIGLCSLFLAVVYVASVFLYIHWRKQKKKKTTKKKEEDAQLTLGEEGVIKNNPLLQANRHLAVCGEDNTGYLTDSNSCCSDPDQISDLLCLDEEDLAMHQNVQTSAIIHPCVSGYGETTVNQEANNIERLPEENVSIVETLEAKETHPETIKAIVASNCRRKLYFNPSYFDPELLKAPPPAALEFLMKIREVIAIAKHKMSNKKFSPSLLRIPEEEGSLKTEINKLSSLNAVKERNANGINRKPSYSIKEEKENIGSASNNHQRPGEFCCPSDAKQKIIQKWLQDVPTMRRKNDPKANPNDNWMKANEEDKMLSNPNFWQTNEPKANNDESAVKEIKKRPSTKARPPPLPPLISLKEKTEVRVEEAEEEFSQSNTCPTRHSTKYECASSLISAMVSPPRSSPSTNGNDKNEMVSLKGKTRIQSHVAKNLMDAVIQELTDYKKNEKNSKAKDLFTPKQEENGIGGETKDPRIQNTSQRINKTESKRIRESEQVFNFNSDERKFVEAEKMADNDTSANGNQDEHEYEVILLRPKPPPVSGRKDSGVHELPERSQGYSLVSEVYVNDSYSCSSGETSPSSLSVSSAEKEKISYEMTNGKTGRLTIQVKDSPKQQKDIISESDGFEPDTLERKQRKSKVRTIGNGNNEEEKYSNQRFHESDRQKRMDVENFTDSLERPTIMLKTNGTFKRNSLENDVNELFRNLRMENFGSLREIYEAKNRNHKRRTETTSLVDSVNSDLDCISTLSWGEERRNKLLHRGIVLHVDEDIDTRRKRRFIQNKSYRNGNDWSEEMSTGLPRSCPISRSRSVSSVSRSVTTSPSFKLKSAFASPIAKNSSPENWSPTSPSPSPLPIRSFPRRQGQSRSMTSSPINLTDGSKSMNATSPVHSSNHNTIVRVRPKNECGVHYQTINSISLDTVSQPSSLPATLPTSQFPPPPRPPKVSVERSPPLPPRSSKPPLPPKKSRCIRQKSDSDKFSSGPPLSFPFSRTEKSTVSYKDLETMSNASADSLNSSEYESFYTMPYEAKTEENDCKEDSDPIAYRTASTSISVTFNGRDITHQKNSDHHHQKGQRINGDTDCKKSPRGKEDSGYLSTDSSESYCPRSVLPSHTQKIPEKVESNVGAQNGSETDESICDGASESGAESTATDSFFYGNFKRPNDERGSSENSDSQVYSYSLRLSDVEVNSDTERHCMPIIVRP